MGTYRRPLSVVRIRPPALELLAGETAIGETWGSWRFLVAPRYVHSILVLVLVLILVSIHPYVPSDTVTW